MLFFIDFLTVRKLNILFNIFLTKLHFVKFFIEKLLNYILLEN